MSLSSLTQLNQRLLSGLVALQTSPAEEEAAVDDIFQSGTGEQPEDPDAEKEEEPEVRGRFSTVDPFEYNRVKEWIELNIFGGTGQGQANLINAFVNEWDIEYRRQQGWGPEENIGDGATLERLLENERFVNGAAWLPLTGTNQLPPVFQTQMEQVDDEGNPTGELVATIGTASPLSGVEFRTVTQIVEAKTPADEILRNRIIRSDTALARDMFQQALQQGIAGTLPTPGGGATVTHVGDRAGEGIRTSGPQPTRTPAPPEISTEEITRMYAEATGQTTSRGRGGGGGGSTTRRELVFDRTHLETQVADRWNRWMLSAQDAPMNTIASWVGEYINKAKAFWSKEGGQLDFDTFITEKLKGTPRYQTIYRDKTPGETEEQFLNRFYQPIAGLGMDSEFTRAQTFQSVTSGAGPAAQLDRVRRTRDVEVQNQGEFSQRLAQTLAGLGVG